MSKKTKEKSDIGIVAKKPMASCSSEYCPWHGHLKVRGRVFTGSVVSDRAPLTATVRWDYLQYVPKYERYARKRTKVSAHNPACIAAKIGDKVKIAECRPISKTKTFVVVERLDPSERSEQVR